jgi:hypothetical protein
MLHGLSGGYARLLSVPIWNGNVERIDDRAHRHVEADEQDHVDEGLVSERVCRCCVCLRVDAVVVRELPGEVVCAGFVL